MTRVIRAEALGEARPWQLSSLGQAAAAKAPAPPKIDPEALLRQRLAQEEEQFRVRLVEQERSAIAQGYEQGFEQGYREGLARSESERDQLRTLIESNRAAFANLQDTTAHALRDLSIDIARQILRCELRLNDAAILPVVREALDSVSSHLSTAQLLVHPDDAVTVQKQFGDELAITHWHVIADPRIEPGGCRISSPQGEYDAQLPSRWKRVIQALGREVPWDAPQEDAPEALEAPTTAETPAPVGSPAPAETIEATPLPAEATRTAPAPPASQHQATADRHDALPVADAGIPDAPPAEDASTASADPEAAMAEAEADTFTASQDLSLDDPELQALLADFAAQESTNGNGAA